MSGLVIVLPLIGYLCGVLTGRFTGKLGGNYLSIICMSLTFILSIMIAFEVCLGKQHIEIALTSWIKADYLSITYTICIDTISSLMITLISIITLIVMVYSTIYMESDPAISRFISTLSLFTFFMIILVTAENLLQIFIGWEGIGVVSYLLVNFWITRGAANRSAMMALLTNRVGDWGYTLSLFIMIASIGSLSLGIISPISNLININLTNIILITLIIGVMGKSAQLGLHIWLPWAMEGPTPVSALLHAATLVTAGVYLLLKISYLLEQSSDILAYLSILGGITAFVGGSMGAFANDIKRIIAFSTCSQLGLMIFSIGNSAYILTAYHLINHGFFKALLFLSAGSIIHTTNDNQDLRKMGFAGKSLTLTYIMLAIASISLMGIPFTTGFYSKESILINSYRYQNIGMILSYLSIIFTIIYSLKIISRTFFGTTNFSKSTNLLVYKENPITLYSLAILAIPSLVAGYYAKDIFNTYNRVFTADIYIAQNNIPYWTGGLFPLASTVILVLLYYIISKAKVLLIIKFNYYYKSLHNIISMRYYIENLISLVISRKILGLGIITSNSLDKGFGEAFGFTGVIKIFKYYIYTLTPSFIKQESPILYSGLLIILALIAYLIVYLI